MRKVMLLAAMLAMVLAAAAPAFAQANIDVEGDDTEYNGVCQNILGSVNTGDNTASADATTGTGTETGNNSNVAVDSDAMADIAQDSGVSVEQANECFNVADLDADGVLTTGELEKFGVVTAAVVQYEGSASASATATLPETGGASLIALGAGALLVAGGLVARRIVR